MKDQIILERWLRHPLAVTCIRQRPVPTTISSFLCTKWDDESTFQTITRRMMKQGKPFICIFKFRFNSSCFLSNVVYILPLFHLFNCRTHLFHWTCPSLVFLELKLALRRTRYCFFVLKVVIHLFKTTQSLHEISSWLRNQKWVHHATRFCVLFFCSVANIIIESLYSLVDH